MQNQLLHIRLVWVHALNEFIYLVSEGVREGSGFKLGAVASMVLKRLQQQQKRHNRGEQSAQGGSQSCSASRGGCSNTLPSLGAARRAVPGLGA